MRRQPAIGNSIRERLQYLGLAQEKFATQLRRVRSLSVGGDDTKMGRRPDGETVKRGSNDLRVLQSQSRPVSECPSQFQPTTDTQSVSNALFSPTQENSGIIQTKPAYAGYKKKGYTNRIWYDHTGELSSSLLSKYFPQEEQRL